MGGCALSAESDGAYITYTLNGSNVKKKLGSEGNAAAADVLASKTFSNADSIGIAGTMADKTGTANYSATASLDATNSRLKMKIPAVGKYGTSNYLYATYATIRTLIGLTAAKIVKGNTILGLAGTTIAQTSKTYYGFLYGTVQSKAFFAHAGYTTMKITTDVGFVLYGATSVNTESGAASGATELKTFGSGEQTITLSSYSSYTYLGFKVSASGYYKVVFS